ncbi:MAG: DUF523 domain-containing protein [Thermodesulfatator sp.]|nr:MAG: DUF523 domain-containing protein [Thermodesulfatator sp.]
MILVSSCLLGVRCRYDGSSRPVPALWDVLGQGKSVVPVCPEQLGGLPTPRPPVFILGGDGFDVLAARAKVVRKIDRQDVTDFFLSGAEECLKLVRLLGIRRAVLKSKSPSCGLSRPSGVTAAALILEGVDVMEF